MRKAREEHGWSQAELARRVGVSTRTVKRWEGNLAAPHSYASQKLCSVLGKTREELAIGRLVEASPEGAIPPNSYEPLYPYVAPPLSSSLRRRLLPLPVMLSSILVAFLLGVGTGAFLKPATLLPLHIRPTSTRAPIPTITRSNPAPYPPAGWKLSFTDPLNQPLYWNNGSDPSFGGSCQFSAGAYYIAQTISGRAFFCTGPSNTFSNLAIEVKVTIITGDCGGIWFRGHGPAYFFEICQNGYYSLRLWGAPTPPVIRTLVSNTSSAIHAGPGQSNLLAVLAIGNHFDFYVNHQKIDSARDSTLSSGQINIGIAADNGPTEVAFTDVKVWIPSAA